MSDVGSKLSSGNIGAALNPVNFALGSAIGGDVGKFLSNPIGSIGDLGTQVGDIFKKPDAVTAPAIAGESELEKALIAQMQGSGPSVAERQLQRGTDLSNRNAMALAASQRGINPGLAAQLAMNQQGMNMTEANAQAGLMRANEQLNAQNLLEQMYASQRGQKLNADLASAQQQSQWNQFMLRGLGQGITSAATMGSGGGSAQPVVANKGALVGGKAKVNGDSPKNDTVPAVLSPGEMIIPRTIVKKGPDAVAEFAKALLKKEGK